MISSPPPSILAALVGLTTGYLYRTDTLFPLPTFSRRRAFRPLKTYRIPLSLHVLLARLCSPLASASPPPRRGHRALPGQVDGRAAATAVQPQQAQANIRNLLTSRLAAAQRQQRPDNLTTPGRDGTAPRTAVLPDITSATAAATGASTTTTGGARQAMGEWVNEMTGRRSGARAPTEEEIATWVTSWCSIWR